MYKIFKDVEYKLLKDTKKFEIKGIEYDSRKIKKDSNSKIIKEFECI